MIPNQKDRSVADVRTKTIHGVTYDDRVKSVRDGKKVCQVFVRYMSNHPSGEGRGPSGGAACCRVSSGPGGFQPLGGVDALTRCVVLFYDLGCQRVVFSLRSKRRHGAVHTRHDPETGEMEITQVGLHREALIQAICHEVGHVLDTVLPKQNRSGGSLSPEFEAHMPALRAIADYTWVDQEGGSPQFLRQLRRDPPSKARERATWNLARYDETYVYRADELCASGVGQLVRASQSPNHGRCCLCMALEHAVRPWKNPTCVQCGAAMAE